MHLQRHVGQIFVGPEWLNAVDMLHSMLSLVQQRLKGVNLSIKLNFVWLLVVFKVLGCGCLVISLDSATINAFLLFSRYNPPGGCLGAISGDNVDEIIVFHIADTSTLVPEYHWLMALNFQLESFLLLFLKSIFHS